MNSSWAPKARSSSSSSSSSSSLSTVVVVVVVVAAAASVVVDNWPRAPYLPQSDVLAQNMHSGFRALLRSDLWRAGHRAVRWYTVENLAK